ncbi:hypothetical protein [Carnobacterium gallinarum]|uniref:hypothetical protein n=1 Tax=Carnobacterium gallinarum TaxID=2749 RepID=UPI000689A82E|nr:hypothetical protein [Carnobacterium gallinarum]
MNDYRLENHYNIEIVEKMKKLISIGAYSLAYDLLKKSTSKESSIIKSLLAEHIVYSLVISLEVSDDITSIDDALVNGFNWIAPQDLIYLFGGVGEFRKLYLKYAENQISQDVLDSILDEVKPSAYDYRKFLKA